MTRVPWESPGRWFTSPWNFLNESRDDLNPPSRVTFHDVFLRDGEQQAGIVLNRHDKVTIAERLAAAGVDRIEAGMPAVSGQDEAAIRDIVQANLGPQIFSFARCMVDDIKKARECDVDGVVVEIPSSKHIIERAYGWPLEKAVDLSIEATLTAKSLGLETIFFTIDSSRAEFDWYLDLVERVATEGHIDGLALVDTFGGVAPHAVPVWVSRVMDRLPDVRLEAHFHDDFGLAVANSVAAICAGVEVVHTTVTGIGERAGNTPMEELALALRMLYGVEHGLVTEEFYGLSRLVQERTGHQVPSNRAVVGEQLFEVESGIIAGWYERCIDDFPTELFPYHWDIVGQSASRVVYGKGSGLPSINVAARALRMTGDEDATRALLESIKQRSLKTKSLLPFEDVARMASRHLEE